MLISDAQTPEAASRIKAMVEYSDGFRIAEEDLKIRGPGEFFGRRQHGLSELKVANPLMQMQLLKKARDEAGKIIKSDPRLKLRQNMALKQRLLYKFPGHEKLMLAG
jgi:ATP-dependent DNA helicase RecG